MKCDKIILFCPKCKEKIIVDEFDVIDYGISYSIDCEKCKKRFVIKEYLL